MNNVTPFGLYIHVPFCDGKCPYCDFYSLPANGGRMEQYTQRLLELLPAYAQRYPRPADTLYFGGGTPSLLGADRLSALIKRAKECFGLDGAEITVEVNPAEDLSGFLKDIRAAGANRLSIGLQSANEDELALLGRRHTAEQAEKAVRAAQSAGFDNISLDLMLAIQKQTRESLLRSIQFCADAGAQHISAYLLKIEPDTVYGKKKETLCVPDDDAAGDLYLFTCEELEKCGFRQYEISNFAKPGYESRHNLKYWHSEEYLGIGPAAHSFMEGKRFFYKRNLSEFLCGAQPVPDGDGGGFEEYAMLALRLTEGLTDKGCRARFGTKLPERLLHSARLYEKGGLTVCGDGGFHFTPKGFLVSNMLTAEILYSGEATHTLR